MRLFVALAISEEVRRQVALLIGELRERDRAMGWVNSQNLHITLKFIGEVPANRVPVICETLASVATGQSLSLEFNGLGFFPDVRRPSVVWVGITSAAQLASLASHIDQALATIGVPREEKPFIPHLTIARIKERRGSPAFAASIEEKSRRSFGVMSAGEFHLMESKLKSGGAEYTTLRSFPFAGNRNEGPD